MSEANRGEVNKKFRTLTTYHLDCKLEERGHRFVRHADDCNIYVKSLRSAKRALSSTSEFIERRMRQIRWKQWNTPKNRRMRNRMTGGVGG